MDYHGPGTGLIVCIYLLIYVWIKSPILGHLKSIGPKPPSYLWWEIWCLPPKSERLFWSLQLWAASGFSWTLALTNISPPWLFPLLHSDVSIELLFAWLFQKHTCIGIHGKLQDVRSKGQLHSRANNSKLDVGHSLCLRDLWPPQLTNSSLHTPALRQSRSRIKMTWGTRVNRAVSSDQVGMGAWWFLKGSPTSWRLQKGKNWQRQAELSFIKQTRHNKGKMKIQEFSF